MQKILDKTLDSWLDLGVLVSIISFVSWYFYDSYNALDSVENLIMIAPISIIILILCLFELRIWFSVDEKNEKDEKIASIIPAIILFGGYALSLEYLGFDVGTSLFILFFLRLYGEGKWLNNVIYSILFGFIVSIFFSQMLPYPMPMLILPTDY